MNQLRHDILKRLAAMLPPLSEKDIIKMLQFLTTTLRHWEYDIISASGSETFKGIKKKNGLFVFPHIESANIILGENDNRKKYYYLGYQPVDYEDKATHIIVTTKYTDLLRLIPVMDVESIEVMVIHSSSQQKMLSFGESNPHMIYPVDEHGMDIPGWLKDILNADAKYESVANNYTPNVVPKYDVNFLRTQYIKVQSKGVMTLERFAKELVKDGGVLRKNKGQRKYRFYFTDGSFYELENNTAYYVAELQGITL